MCELFLVGVQLALFVKVPFQLIPQQPSENEKKINFIIYYYFFLGRVGLMSAVAANMKNLSVDLEHVDMYIFFINHCEYLIY